MLYDTKPYIPWIAQESLRLLKDAGGSEEPRMVEHAISWILNQLQRVIVVPGNHSDARGLLVESSLFTSPVLFGKAEPLRRLSSASSVDCIFRAFRSYLREHPGLILSGERGYHTYLWDDEGIRISSSPVRA